MTSLGALSDTMGGELPHLKHGEYAPAVIVLLTDGENTDGPSPLDVVGEAVDRGIRVYTIGIGSPTSSTIHVGAAPIQAAIRDGPLRVTPAQCVNDAGSG